MRVAVFGSLTAAVVMLLVCDAAINAADAQTEVAEASEPAAPTPSDADPLAAQALAAAPGGADAPLYTPLTARFMIDEILRLRSDLERTRAELIERQTQREYAIAREATSYSRNAIELFFFVITAVASLGALIGWNTLRDVKKRIQDVAQKKVNETISSYSERLDALEAELQEKSERLRQAQAEIDETNAIHSLWLRASQEPSHASKIAVYDDILKMRPDDVEALTFKADAALGLNEPQWAVSLSNRALAIDPESAQAHYQRACALAWTDRDAEALADLAKAIESSDAFRDLARTDPAFDRIRATTAFAEIVGVDQELQSEAIEAQLAAARSEAAA